MIAFPIVIVLMMHHLLGKKAIDLLHDESFCISEFRDQENGGYSGITHQQRSRWADCKLMLKRIC